jgi:hypothetical protein
LNNLKQWFSRYVQSFYSSDPIVQEALVLKENHGGLGVKVLQHEKTLAALNEDTQELVLKTISYHNRLSVPEDESHMCIYFSSR